MKQSREKYFGQKDHVRVYGRDYKNRLEKVGFNVKIYKAEEVEKELFRKLSLFKNEIIHIGKK